MKLTREERDRIQLEQLRDLKERGIDLTAEGEEILKKALDKS